MEISATPTINPTTNSGIYNYLPGVSNDALFAQEVLKNLIQERCTRHRGRHNSNLTSTQDFKVDYIFKACVQVQSYSDSGNVKKLGSQVSRSFKIIEYLGHNLFHVQRLDDDNGAIHMYKVIELYLLPPVIFLSDPLDRPDQQYLNYEHAPIVHPLNKSLKIEMYNDTYFTKPPPTNLKQQIDHPSNSIDKYLQT